MPNPAATGTPTTPTHEEPTPSTSAFTGESHQGIPILKYSDDSLAVPGTVPTKGNIEPVGIFGESGEVFNHMSWRLIFAVLWSQAPAKNTLIALASYFLLRGKTAKIESKNQCKSFSIPIGNLTTKEKAILGNAVSNYSLKINFPTSSSIVPGHALTPERFKCCLRTIMVPELIKAGRFPAISESIGYGEMGRSLICMFRDLSSHKKGEEETRDMEIWSGMLANPSLVPKCSISAMVAGCFSSKEIYLEDDEMFPGCIWWSGCHALMNDVCNKLKASTSPADVRSRLENSNFYGDHKRKLAARGITVSTSAEYYTFLETLQPIMVKFIRIGSGLSEREVNVMDSVLKGALTSVKEVRPSISTEAVVKAQKLEAVGGTDYKSVEKDVKESLAKLLT